ncbi:uncharacterized protein LOC141614244 [Silene latifolia]|uniref:uncharacterized protein LOC141614244 n=1 Tax=Silene latifolia TaxID=37657 RepID=UPI003D771AD1
MSNPESSEVNQQITQDQSDTRTLVAMIAEAVKGNKSNGEDEGMKYFRKMASYNPRTYDGKIDPVVFEDWVRGMDKLFKAVNCPDKWKVGFAVYYLVGQADLWWETVKEKKNEEGFGWSEFKELLRSKFYPVSLRRQKEEEFNSLRQGSMSVMEYAAKFMELSRFAPHMVATEELRMNRFERGLNWSLRDRLSTHTCLNYQEMYDKATNAERIMKEREGEQTKPKRKFEGGGALGQNYQNKQLNLAGGRFPSNMFQGRNQMPRCAKCGLTNHNTNQCRYPILQCFECGSPDHKRVNCPIARSKPPGVGTNTNNNNPPRIPPGSQGNMVQRQGLVPGRVYVMNAQEAEHSNDVVTGNILFNSTPVSVLFDTGATHSFISHSLSKKLKLVPSKPDIGLLIGLPTVETIPCSVVYKDCTITIEENPFLVDLVQLDLHDFDIILGMDWLIANHVLIDCHKKIVTISKPNQDKINFQGVKKNEVNRIISLVKTLKLLRQECEGFLCEVHQIPESEPCVSNIPVVREFADVFPEEIPGMPPHREVDFTIELVPGVGPISKAPYRMAPAELRNSKINLMNY